MDVDHQLPRKDHMDLQLNTLEYIYFSILTNDHSSLLGTLNDLPLYVLYMLVVN